MTVCQQMQIVCKFKWKVKIHWQFFESPFWEPAFLFQLTLRWTENRIPPVGNWSKKRYGFSMVLILLLHPNSCPIVFELHSRSTLKKQIIPTDSI